MALSARQSGAVSHRLTAWGPMVGLVVSALLVVVAAFGSTRFKFYSGFTDHFNTIGATFFFFLVCWPLMAIIYRVARRRLSAADRALIYLCLMMATVVPTMGTCGYLLPLISGVSYYATGENGWRALLVEHLPPFLITSPGQASAWFYEGLPPGLAPPYHIWYTPLLFWGSFFLVLAVVSLAAMILMRRQWEDHEHLAYPLTALPLELIGAAPPRRSPLWVNRLFWMGFVLALGITFYNAAALLINGLFMVSLRPATFSTWFSLFRRTVGVSVLFDPLVIGLSYLVTVDVLLGVIVFYWLTTVQVGILNLLGVDRATGMPHAAGGGLMALQQSGALLFMTGLALWNARAHLAALWRGQADDRREIAPYRLCLFLFLAGSGVLWYMLTITGLSAALAAFVLLVALSFFLGTTYLLAQTGIGRLRAPHSTAGLVGELFGTARMTPPQLAALGLTFIWGGDIQLFTMGTAAMGLQAVHRARPDRPRWAFPTAMAAAALALLTAFAAYLTFGYKYGAHGGFGWYFEASPVYHWGWIEQQIRGGSQPSWSAWALMALGGGATFLVDLLHRQYSWWPLHPAGLAIAQINTVVIDWFSIFLAWLLKVVILRYGGAGAFRQSLPFFLGMVAGSCAGISLSFVVNMLTA